MSTCYFMRKFVEHLPIHSLLDYLWFSSLTKYIGSSRLSLSLFAALVDFKIGPRESDGSGFCRDGRHDYDNCVIHIVPCVVHSLFYFFFYLFSVISFFMERTTIKRFPKTQLCPLLRPLDPLVVSSAFAPTSFLLSFPQKARRLVLRGSCFRALWGTAAVTVSQKHSPPHIF